MLEAVIDISHWQDKVDFEAVKRSGVLGVIHKATEGSGNTDDRYGERRRQAEDVGLLWGAYHFLRPGDMVAQAKRFVEVAGEIDVYAADHEDPGVSVSQLKEFLREVQKLTGRDTLVVYSGHVIKEQLSGRDEELAKHRLWLAHYTSSPTWETATWPKWWLWQWTDQGSCDGVSGKCDRNRYDGTAEELAAEWMMDETDVDEGKVSITITVRGIDPADVEVRIVDGD